MDSRSNKRTVADPAKAGEPTAAMSAAAVADALPDPRAAAREIVELFGRENADPIARFYGDLADAAERRLDRLVAKRPEDKIPQSIQAYQDASLLFGYVTASEPPTPVVLALFRTCTDPVDVGEGMVRGAWEGDPDEKSIRRVVAHHAQLAEEIRKIGAGKRGGK